MPVTERARRMRASADAKFLAENPDYAKLVMKFARQAMKLLPAGAIFPSALQARGVT